MAEDPRKAQYYSDQGGPCCCANCLNLDGSACVRGGFQVMQEGARVLYESRPLAEARERILAFRARPTFGAAAGPTPPPEQQEARLLALALLLGIDPGPLSRRLDRFVQEADLGDPTLDRARQDLGIPIPPFNPFGRIRP